jgi:GTP cyclohydrolase II
VLQHFWREPKTNAIGNHLGSLRRNGGEHVMNTAAHLISNTTHQTGGTVVYIGQSGNGIGRHRLDR